GSDPWK
nr:Chain P, EH domain-binding mitotic phosphoprotein [synthetic construct]